MRRPLFGNGYPVPVEPGEEVVVFDASQAQDVGEITFFTTLYYYFSPETREAEGSPWGDVVLTATENIDLTSAVAASVDGVAVGLNNRVFLGSQANPVENGIYIAVGTAPNSWARVPDMGTAADFAENKSVKATAGDTQKDVQWLYIGPVSAGIPVVDTDPLIFLSKAGVNAQVYVDNGPGTPQILLEDVDNLIATGLFIIDKGAMLAVDRLPITATGRLIIKSEPASTQKFWLLGFYELGAADTSDVVGQRVLQPNKLAINTQTAFQLKTPAIAPGGNPSVQAVAIHELTTEYIDEITLFGGVTSDKGAEPVLPETI
jgi:hypothetical protein